MKKHDLVTRAVTYAALAHANQSRKGTALPYIVHPAEAMAIAGAERGTRNYLRSFPADGSCNEGIAYWDYGFGSYAALALAVSEATGGRLLLNADDPVLPKVAAFGHDFQLMDGVAPAFADGDGVPENAAMAMGRALAPSALPASLSSYSPLAGFSENYGPFAQPCHLVALRAFVEGAPAKDAPETPLPTRTYYPDAQVLLSRDATRRFAVAVKGGHNHEQHNHNDVGSYSIALDGVLVAGDVGHEQYTGRTFSPKRYESKVLGSYGHPVPRVGGLQQPEGARFRAKVLATDWNETRDVIRLDLKDAYPTNALTRLERTLTFDRENGVCTICDDVAFAVPTTLDVPTVTVAEVTRKVSDWVFMREGRRLAVSVEVSGGAWHWEEEVWDNPNLNRPHRIAVTFDKPVSQARVIYTFRPLPPVPTTGEIVFRDCFARWTATGLNVGNAAFTRTYAAAGTDLKTLSLVSGGKEWIDAGRVGKTGDPLMVEAVAASRGVIGEKGIRLTVATRLKVRTLWIFPDVPGVLKEDPNVVDLSHWKPSDWLYDNVYGKLPHYLAGADVLRLVPRHVKATECVLQDMTDIRNELMEENSWLLMTREEPLVRSAPVLSLENTFTGDGLVFLRVAPLPHDRPDSIPDFVLAASENTDRPNRVFVASVANSYPVAELVYRGGRTGRIRALHAVQRALRPYRSGRDGQFLTNTWGDGNRDSRINADFVMKEIVAGGELGVDVIQVDDGWQYGKSINSAFLEEAKETGAWAGFRAYNPDFWKLDPIKFPQGLEPLVAAARERGIGFGLWFGPDKTADNALWKLDAETLLDFYRKHGIRYFKIDGIEMGSAKAFGNIRRMFDLLLERSSGEMTFDLDVTGAWKRPGYFGLPDIGPLFMENRYVGGKGNPLVGNYWPHFTLRNLWTLSQVIDPVRLRVELNNPLHGTENYGDDPLAPKFWRGDALFATVMCASPLGWFETSGLDPKTVAEIKPLVQVWKRERANLHGGFTIPVGVQPDGLSWTGFATEGADGKTVYALLFRELNPSADHVLELPFGNRGQPRVQVIGGAGKAALQSSNQLAVAVPERLGFIWVKLTW